MSSRFPAALLAHSFLNGLNFAPRLPRPPEAPAASRGNHVPPSTSFIAAMLVFAATHPLYRSLRNLSLDARATSTETVTKIALYKGKDSVFLLVFKTGNTAARTTFPLSTPLHRGKRHTGSANGFVFGHADRYKSCSWDSIMTTLFTDEMPTRQFTQFLDFLTLLTPL